METAPLEHKLKQAILDELRRQAENSEGALSVRDDGEDRLTVQGTLDLDDLVMVITGSVAGGP